MYIVNMEPTEFNDRFLCEVKEESLGRLQSL